MISMFSWNFLLQRKPSVWLLYKSILRRNHKITCVSFPLFIPQKFHLWFYLVHFVITLFYLSCIIITNITDFCLVLVFLQKTIWVCSRQRWMLSSTCVVAAVTMEAVILIIYHHRGKLDFTKLRVTAIKDTLVSMKLDYTQNQIKLKYTS